MKYNVNDKVRVRKDLKCGNYYGRCYVNDVMEEFAGKVVTISSVFEKIERYEVKEDKKGWYWSEEMFEGLTSFTKSDLQEGDICTLRNGDKDKYLDENFQNYDIDNYNEDLTDVDSEKEYDIVKVERPLKIETVFEREEEPTELTISEIKAKFGITGLLKIKEDE